MRKYVNANINEPRHKERGEARIWKEHVMIKLSIKDEKINTPIKNWWLDVEKAYIDDNEANYLFEKMLSELKINQKRTSKHIQKKSK